MNKKYNKEIKAQHNFTLEGLGHTTVYVTESEQTDYYDVYIVDERFKDDELNTLDQQIPKKNFEEWFLSEEWANMQALQKELWAKYSTNEDIKSYAIEVYND